MNIAIFSWRDPGHPNAGGAEISTHEHAKGWVAAGHKVTLFTAAFKDCKEYEVMDGVNIVRRGKHIFGVQWEAFKWYLFGKHSKFDLVIDQFHGIPFFTPLYIRAKKIGFIHEVTKEVWRLNPWPKPVFFIPAILGTLIEPLIFKFLYQKIPFMTVSNSTKKDLMEWGILEENITIIYNGVNVPKIKLPSKDSLKTLIFLGALSKDKGIEDALEVFSKINEKEGCQFWVVGKSDPRYIKLLKKKSKELGIDKRIKFWGYVDEYKKFNLLGRSHILVNPSIREGWGLVVIEAAAMGTPTIGFNVPGLRDSIINGQTGILSEKKSVKDLANEIIRLLENKRKLSQMSENAILWSKNFSWDKASKASLSFIEKIMRQQYLQN